MEQPWSSIWTFTSRIISYSLRDRFRQYYLRTFNRMFFVVQTIHIQLLRNFKLLQLFTIERNIPLSTAILRVLIIFLYYIKDEQKCPRIYKRQCKYISRREGNRTWNCIAYRNVVTYSCDFSLNYLLRKFIAACSESKDPKSIELHSFLCNMLVYLISI